MKKLKLILVAFFLLPCVCFALTPWGVPAYVDIAAYAINDYSKYRINYNLSINDLSDLKRSIIHKNTFINQLQGRLKSKYPNISSTLNYNRENSTATKSNFLNDNTDFSEFVFVSGHGYYNALLFYDYELQASSKVFGNYTRWIIFDNCLTLNTSTVNLFTWLSGGAHAILGNRSKTWEFSKSSYTSEELFVKFTTRFVTNGEALWSSYNNAVKEAIYINGGKGVEPAIAFLSGNADNGQSVYFSLETLQNVYNGPFSYQYGATNLKINFTSQIYGTPAY